MNKGWIILLGAILAALTLAFFNEDQVDTQAPEGPVIERNEPDLYGENVQFDQLHDDGTLHYRLWANHIRQFTQDQLMRMQVPRLHLRSPNQPPWDIRANEGFIRQAQTDEGLLEDIVFLRDTVRMHQQHPVNGPLTLKSESFYLYPDRQFAETHENVTIDTEVGRTTAGGMRADLDTGVLTLFSSSHQNSQTDPPVGPQQRVHTIVLPEQFKKQ